MYGCELWKLFSASASSAGISVDLSLTLPLARRGSSALRYLWKPLKQWMYGVQIYYDLPDGVVFQMACRSWHTCRIACVLCPFPLMWRRMKWIPSALFSWARCWYIPPADRRTLHLEVKQSLCDLPPATVGEALASGQQNCCDSDGELQQ